jgi:hypothetical protein
MSPFRGFREVLANFLQSCHLFGVCVVNDEDRYNLFTPSGGLGDVGLFDLKPRHRLGGFGHFGFALSQSFFTFVVYRIFGSSQLSICWGGAPKVERETRRNESWNAHAQKS